MNSIQYADPDHFAAMSLYFPTFLPSLQRVSLLEFKLKRNGSVFASQVNGLLTLLETCGIRVSIAISDFSPMFCLLMRYSKSVSLQQLASIMKPEACRKIVPILLYFAVGQFVSWKKFSVFSIRIDVTQMYRVIHKSLRNFRTRLRNNQERQGRKEHINRQRISRSFFCTRGLGVLAGSTARGQS